MPTYQYACTECGEPLEVVQSFTDDALTECPSCGGRLRKQYNAVGIVFKGSGFYRTDSRAGTGSSKNGSSSDKSTVSSEGSKVDGSSKTAATNGSGDKAGPAGKAGGGEKAKSGSGTSAA